MVEILDLIAGPDIQVDHVILRIAFSILGETAADENGKPIPGIKVIERNRVFTIEK